MKRFRLKASCGWVSNSQIDFGVEEFETEDAALEAAHETASERIEVWVEEVAEEVE